MLVQGIAERRSARRSEYPHLKLCESIKKQRSVRLQTPPASRNTRNTAQDLCRRVKTQMQYCRQQ